MMIVACQNWQSQMFWVRPNGGTQGYGLLDLSTATQLMSKRGKGFEPERISRGRVDIDGAARDIRLAELAHIAIANQWRGFHAKDLNALLKNKRCDPMLGILGLHLLLLRPQPDLESANQILARLRDEILEGFPHPDVNALEIEIARRQHREIPHTGIDFPPMLRCSWLFLLQATAEKPSLISNDSFAARISDRLWGSGAWLAWVTPDAKQSRRVDEIIWPAAEYRQTSALRGLVDNLSDRLFEWDLRGFLRRRRASRSGLSEGNLSKKEDFELLRQELEAFLPSLDALIKKYGGIEKLAKKANLNRAELTLLSLLNVKVQLEPEQESLTPASSLSLESLVRSVGMPADRIETTILSLLAKLAPLAKKNK